jgi:hypothetical protein
MARRAVMRNQRRTASRHANSCRFLADNSLQGDLRDG